MHVFLLKGNVRESGLVAKARRGGMARISSNRHQDPIRQPVKMGTNDPHLRAATSDF